MAELHEALKSLSPTTWDEVPTEDASLSTYMTDVFSNSELICNSIPPPLSGTPFHDSQPQYTSPNTATGWKDMLQSSARSHPAHDEHESLQKNWGKAMKFSQKENPLNIAVYKMAGHDRHGAWFARRSVHEGMGFEKFKRGMVREFPESLKVQGGPGEGNVRGIGGDQKLEIKEIEGVGKAEVYQLSAQFPGPTTPREFVTLLLTTGSGMSDKSAAELKGGERHVPRSFMIVSKPVRHPGAPDRQGYIRGQYESVELIREIPITPSKAKSTSNLLNSSGDGAKTGRDRASTIAFTESRGPEAKGEQRDLQRGSKDASQDAELNPVEWIMITRSDPGGGIPRFMVDRGTPSALISDLHKWLDWAAQLREDGEEKDAVAATEPQSNGVTQSEQPPTQPATTSTTQSNPPIAPPRKSMTLPLPNEAPPQPVGVFAHLTQALGSGIDQYAPSMVSSYLHGQPQGQPADADYESDSSSDSSVSDASFQSATSMRRRSTTGQLEEAAQSNVSLTSLERPESRKDMSGQEKDLRKLIQQRSQLTRKLAEKREAEQTRLDKSKDSESDAQTKAQDRFDREIGKAEAKHTRDLERLTAKEEKLSRKTEAKIKKREDRDQLSRVSRERDEFREQVGTLRREREVLLERLGELQKENTNLVLGLGRADGGKEILRKLREEGGEGKGRARAGSGRSRGSTESKAS
ncbi:hypothetical protein B0A48_11451 [Cryoendolithus antarcticus]|uniref:DUF3074 domain-containing protein n=1 Tax=Cryoendolithus antarcticus TaxID=1507870 RepID=A0A1V8SVM6_9PEZI|nr:hypothetical protein B0A48_11451 [Cryoendolithus antarcticus]